MANNADDDYDKFIVTFDDLCNECIPLKKNIIVTEKRNRMNVSLDYKGLLKSINEKNRLYKQYLNSPSKERLQKFKPIKTN